MGKSITQILSKTEFNYIGDGSTETQDSLRLDFVWFMLSPKEIRRSMKFTFG